MDDTGALTVLGAALESSLDMAVNLFVVRYERNKGRELQSASLLADAAHTRRHLRDRTGARVAFAEVTIGVPAQTSVAEAHAVADKVEARIGEQLGASEVTVHVERV